MISTIKLFDLFFKTGLLRYESTTALELLKAMDHTDSVRSRPLNKFFECVHVNKQDEPIAYVSASPCFSPSVWLMSHHCSTVPGHGIGIMIDVMKAVLTNDAIKYVVGIFNSKYNRSAKIWKLVYKIMDNPEICDLADYKVNKGILYPAATVSKLYLEAFGQANHEIGEKTTEIFAHEKEYCSILLKVCEESKNKFKQLPTFR